MFGRAGKELPALVRAGLLREIESRDAVAYDPNPDPTHQHFRCRECGRLHDVHVDGVDGLRITDEKPFVVHERTVLLQGLCPSCSSAGVG